jgi:CBS domain-containing protein
MAATESASAAAKAMKDRGTGTVLVVAGGRLDGLVTDRDITIRVLAENRDPLTTRLGDICTTDLAVLSPDDDVQKASPWTKASRNGQVKLNIIRHDQA